MKKRYETAKNDYLTLSKMAKVKKVAKKEAKKVMTALVEKKWLQYRIVYSPTDVAQWSGAAFDVAPGDGNGQRNGDKIMPFKVKMEIRLTAGDATNFIRGLLVRFRDNDSGAIGAPFDANKILLPGATAVIDYSSQYLYSNKKNYDVLFDKTWTLVQQADTHIRTLTKTIKLGKIPIVYNPTALTGSGRLFWIFMSDSNVVSHPDMEFTSTFWYTDA